VESPKSCR